MSSHYKNKPKTEEEYLKLASLLLGRSDAGGAATILENARQEFPAASRILNALGKVYLTIGKPEKAAQCFQQVLNRAPSNLDIVKDIPSSKDFEYLEQKEADLNEDEYTYLPADQDLSLGPQKTLTLSGEKRSSEQIKIAYKKRIPSSVNQANDELSSASNDAEKVSERAASQSIDRDEIDTSVGEESSSGNLESTDLVEMPASDDLRNFGTDPQSLGDADEDQDSIFYDGDDIDELDSSLDDSIEGNSPSDWDVDIYGQWDDELFDEEQEDEIEELALGNQLDREDRARQAAIDFAVSVDWCKESLSFLTDVFTDLGWGNTRRALEREVLSGATLGELDLAFQVKTLWRESDRYWINFNGAWALGESTTATYKQCSWRQAMQLVRTFEDLPSYEELCDFLDDEFDYWYNNKHLRHLFPAFIKYLFKFRLNRALPTLPIEEKLRFDISVDFDEMNTSWSYHALSNEISRLRTLGLDIINRFSPKSYYVSDKPFDPKSLDPIKRNPLEDDL